jgi:hypothetical protein
MKENPKRGDVIAVMLVVALGLAMFIAVFRTPFIRRFIRSNGLLQIGDSAKIGIALIPASSPFASNAKIPGETPT